MRGRMPFPDPLLPIAIVAMIGGLIIPTCLHLMKESKVKEVPTAPSFILIKTQAGTPVLPGIPEFRSSLPFAFLRAFRG
jgi:hypothetical protein